MKNYIILTLICLLAAIDSEAQQVTPSEARLAASEFFGNSQVFDTPAHIRAAKGAGTTAETDSRPYYVFTTDSDAGGFVIVSGDKRLNKIIGYSRTSGIDLDNLPPQLSALLGGLQEKIDGMPASTPAHKSWSKAAQTNPESTVLETAAWGQSAPYNGMCPEVNGQRCVTGCVATAMAIIMKYHDWPPKGRGKHSTPCDIGFIGSNEIDFDFETDFAFDNMLNNYEADSPQDNCDAVAKLMLAAGAATHMNYGVGESGASPSFVASPMIYNFRYSPEVTYISCIDAYTDPSTLKYSYTREELNDIIRQQINDGMPVLGGTYNHLMVIDGFDDDGLFHINWGWDGGSNGFYDINNLTINGNVLSAIINIKPDKSDINISEAHLCDSDIDKICSIRELDWFYPWLNISTSKVSKGEKFDAVSGYIFFPDNFCGEYGLAIVDEDYNIVEVLKTNYIDSHGFPGQYSTHIEYTNLTPTAVIEPTYKVQIVTRTEGALDWAIVPSTRQAVSWAPCSGYEPKTIKLNYSTIGDVAIKEYAIGNGNFIDNGMPPASLLKGMSLTLRFNVDYNAWLLDNYDYRLSLSINGKARSNVYSSNEKYYFNEDENNIVLALTPVSELQSTEINLSAGERLTERINHEDALKTRVLVVSGTVDAADINFINNAFPELEYLDMASATVENGLIPASFLRSSLNLKSVILPSNTKTVSNYAFTGSPLDYISIPATVEIIGHESFGRNEKLKEIWVESPLYHPNDLSSAAFWECDNIKESVLHVPASEVEACKKHYIWSKFGSIVASAGEVEKLVIYEPPVEMQVGETHGIRVRALPDYAENKDVEFETSDNSVATVDDQGIITANNFGTATITARSVQNPEIKATCEVSVPKVSGIDTPEVAAPNKADVYNISGIRVKKDCNGAYGDGLAPGVYILRKGDTTEKFIVR